MTPPTSRRVAPGATPFVVAGLAPMLWFTHLVTLYALVPWSCRVDSDLPMHAATGVAALGLAASAVVARRVGPRPRTGTALHARLVGGGGRAVTQLVAVVLALYFLGVVLITGVTPLLVDRCA